MNAAELMKRERVRTFEEARYVAWFSGLPLARKRELYAAAHAEEPEQLFEDGDGEDG